MFTPASKLAGDPETWGTRGSGSNGEDEEKRGEGRFGETHGVLLRAGKED
jgi:hypothetical protein